MRNSQVEDTVFKGNSAKKIKIKCMTISKECVTILE